MEECRLYGEAVQRGLIADTEAIPKPEDPDETHSSVAAGLVDIALNDPDPSSGRQALMLVLPSLPLRTQQAVVSCLMQAVQTWRGKYRELYEREHSSYAG